MISVPQNLIDVGGYVYVATKTEDGRLALTGPLALVDWVPPATSTINPSELEGWIKDIEGVYAQVAQDPA